MQDFQNTATFVQILRKINNGDDKYFLNSKSDDLLHFENCLELLAKNSLIKQEEDAMGYAITQEGIAYLRAHDRFIKFLLKK